MKERDNKEEVSDGQSELSFGWKETEIQKYTTIFQTNGTKDDHNAYTLKKKKKRNQGCVSSFNSSIS